MSNFQFKPNIWLTLITIIGLTLFINLGIWQLNRAEQKQQRLDLFEQNSVLPARLITGENDFEDITNVMYRKVAVRGSYDRKFLFALDNQQESGKIGFHIYTPFRLKNSESVILVNRGWVPLENHKRSLPNIETDNALVLLKGMAYILSEPPLKLGDTSIKTGAREIVQYIDLNKLATDLNIKLLPFVLLLDKDDETGFVRNWKIVAAPPEKSTSYAMQWFSFAVLLSGLYIGLNLKRKK